MVRTLFLAAALFATPVTLGITLLAYGLSAGQVSSPSWEAQRQPLPFKKKINLVFAAQRTTSNPPGGEEYDGTPYNPARGYGWLAEVSVEGNDGGLGAAIALDNATESSPRDLRRLELANWQGKHQENLPLVFRIDLPDGWYRVSCTSVASGIRRLPLVDQRSIKCRAHDAVFLGANYGAPLVVSGNQLVEGSGIVEVTDGHLRIVVGDPAYGGWTWAHPGPWYEGWRPWWRWEHRFATGWYQKLTRTVDPGFHSLRLNSLVVERVLAPAEQPSLVFRDFFNRDDNQDVNVGISAAHRWVKVKLHPEISGHIGSELYKTSMRLIGPQSGSGLVGLLQQQLSPAEGTVRYSTRVSLFLGEGSQLRSGRQEAGLLLLAEPSKPTEFTSTFVGVAFDSSRRDTGGWLKYCVGNGDNGYQLNSEISDTALPFRITKGEYEILVEHNVREKALTLVQVNGVDVTNQWSLADRTQRLHQGLFGIRSAMDNLATGVKLQQFYWYYRAETL